MKHKGYNNQIIGRDHQYGYNGKEENDELGLQWHDFSARNYDASLGRWMNIDALADIPKQIEYSPYSSMANNPIIYIDPDGNCFTKSEKGEHISCAEGEIGDTIVDSEGTTWTYGDNGWDTDAYNDRTADLGTFDKENYEYWKQINKSAEIIDKLVTLETGKTSEGRSREIKEELRLFYRGQRLKFKKAEPYAGSPMDYIGGVKGMASLVVKFSNTQKMAWWTNTAKNLIKLEDGVKLLSKEKLEYYKRILNLGASAGRSGGHGTSYIRAGNDLIREANKSGVAKDFAELLKREGKRLIEKGKSINHK